jgi:hypothetical protein
MKTVYLLRTRTSDQGTEGTLITDGFICKTLELPWRENKQSISCIPSGEYNVVIRKSPKYGTTYWVTKVPNRSYILIHAGNWAGDTKKGFKTHVNGCILLGKDHGFLSDQRAILNSKVTVRKFRNTMVDKPFTLNVIGGESSWE